MSNLLYYDPFDSYSASQGARRWTQWANIALVPGRTGNGAQFNTGSNASKTFAQGVQSICTVGFALKNSAFGFPCLLGNAATGLGFRPSLLGDGRAFVTVNTPSHSTDSSPSTFVFNIGIWYFIELQASIVGSVVAGNSRATVTYNLKVNNATILSGTLAADWNGTVDPTQISWSYFQASSNVGGLMDDLYITDNEFLGDVAIVSLVPNGEGDSLQWTPLSGGVHNAMVSEIPADDDTTYIYDDGSSLNHIDLFQMTDIAGSPGILGAQVVLTVKNDIAGSATLQAELKSGGTVHDGVSANLTTNSYICILDPMRKNPITSTDFTAAEINAIQVGVKRTA